MRRLQERRVAEMNVGGGLQQSTPEAEGIDPHALQKLVERAHATHSSAVVLVRHGKLIGQWYPEGPSVTTETMSATKAVVSLAVGLLLDEGKIRSPDQPVSTWFPEWKDGVHEGITLRHLLNHTSGLHADRTAARIYASNDLVRFALQSGIDAPPGSEYFYNNSAVNLVAGVVQRASGRPMDDYLRSRLFGPLGIRDVSWTHDRTGNPYGMAGLRIHAADFAKIGQMMLWGGTWNGKRVVSEAWIDQSTQRPAQAFQPLSGLLWWLEAPNANVVIDQPFLDALRDRGADSVFIAKLEPLRDHRIPKAEFRDELRRALGSDAVAQWTKEAGQRRLEARTVVSGEYDGFSARGSYGQILLVYPSRDLVAVRFTTSLDPSDPTVGFSDFATLVRALAVPTTH